MGVALLSPLDSLGETDLLSAHMAQHLLIADLSAPLLVIGLRSPVYAFMLPRAMFAAIARSHRLRAVFRFLKQPLVAAPLWISCCTAGTSRPPTRPRCALPSCTRSSTSRSSWPRCWCGSRCSSRRAAACPGELWKIAHITGTRFAGMFLGMAFVILQTPIYEGFYGQRALEHGLTPAEDQQIAGGLMLAVDFAVMMGALVFFFMRAASDADRKQAEEDRARGARPPVHSQEVGLG